MRVERRGVYDIDSFRVFDDGSLDWDLARRVIGTSIDREWAAQANRSFIKPGETLWVVRGFESVERVIVKECSYYLWYGNRVMLGKEETEDKRICAYAYSDRIIHPILCGMYELY